jgi:cysteine desulfurase family protein (TIGR01976 family)
MIKPTLNVASTLEIRSHFPALERRHRGHSAAYFDGPGGTQIPREVAVAINDYLFNHNANVHWAYPTSAETDQILGESRQTVADLFNCAPQEVTFGANMTTITFHVARALGRQLGPGDEIVVTELDHHGNVAPWREIAGERGLTIRVVRMSTATGQIDWDDLESALNRRTRVLAIGAASNALGTINDLPRAIELAHAAGALVFIDAVHYVPHVLVDVRQLGCDLLACSAYKFYGPHLGIMYGRHELLQSLDVPKLEPATNQAPERVETGTQNHEAIAGAAAAIDFLASLSAEGATRRERLQQTFKVLHSRSAELLSRMWEGLNSIEGVSVCPPEPNSPRTPTLSFVVERLPSIEVARQLSDRGLFVSHGNFYAKTVVERLGRTGQGLVRAGCACYTTLDEVERLIEGVREIAS